MTRALTARAEHVAGLRSGIGVGRGVDPTCNHQYPVGFFATLWCAEDNCICVSEDYCVYINYGFWFRAWRLGFDVRERPAPSPVQYRGALAQGWFPRELSAL